MSFRDEIKGWIREARDMKCSANKAADQILALLDKEQGEVVGWVNVYQNVLNEYYLDSTHPHPRESCESRVDSAEYIATVPIRLPAKQEEERDYATDAAMQREIEANKLYEQHERKAGRQLAAQQKEDPCWRITKLEARIETLEHVIEGLKPSIAQGKVCPRGFYFYDPAKCGPCSICK